MNILFSVEIVEALCRHPYIDLDSRNKDGITALMVRLHFINIHRVPVYF